MILELTKEEINLLVRAVSSLRHEYESKLEPGSKLMSRYREAVRQKVTYCNWMLEKLLQPDKK